MAHLTLKNNLQCHMALSQEGNKNWLGLIKCLFESIYFQTSDRLNEFEARFSLL